MTYTHYHVGDYIGLPAEPPVGTTLRARVIRDGQETDSFLVRRNKEGWYPVGASGHPVPWWAAVQAWGPGSDLNGAFEVVKLPAM